MNNLKKQLVEKKFFGEGMILRLKEIPPSMLVDYNIKFLKIWRFLRKKNFNFHSPKPEMLSINFKGNITLNNIDNIVRRTKMSSSLNTYFKYFLNKLLILNKNPALAYLFYRSNFIDLFEFNNLSKIKKIMLPQIFLKTSPPNLVLNLYQTLLFS